jgi:hypothetical protein
MLSRADQTKIRDIADRAVTWANDNNIELTLTKVILAVGLAHEQRPLKLNALLFADDFNFVHDVWGIMRHIDYSTGKMKDCFLPRFAKKLEPAGSCYDPGEIRDKDGKML